MIVRDVLFRSGDLFLPQNLRRILDFYLIGNSQSLFYVNVWSIVHFLSGIIAGSLVYQYHPRANYYFSLFVLHSIWELWQVFILNTKYWTTRGLIDILTDTIFFMSGTWIFIQYKKNFLSL